MNRFYVGKATIGVIMGMESVLQSIKNAEESALQKIADSKDEAAKILACLLYTSDAADDL